MVEKTEKDAEIILAREFLLSDSQIEFANSVGYRIISGEIGGPVQFISKSDSPAAAVLSALVLNHFMSNTSSIDDLFNEVNNLYCGLDHPEALESIVSYMPTEDADPSPDRLKQKIKQMRDKLLREHFLGAE